MRKSAAPVGLSKGVVSKYVNLAKALGITWPLPPGMDEAQLECQAVARSKKRPSRLCQTRLSQPFTRSSSAKG